MTDRTSQDAEAVARETLAMLAKFEGGMEPVERLMRHAAECVRFVAALERGDAPQYDAESHSWVLRGEFWAEGDEFRNAFDAWKSHRAAQDHHTTGGASDA